MPKYKCTNKDCTYYNKIVTKDSTIRVVDGEVVDSAKRCFHCNKDMETVRDPGMTTAMHGGVNICNK